MLQKIAAAFVVVFACAAPAGADPTGVWVEKDGDTIRVFPCGQGFCATIASVEPRRDSETGKPRTDKNNADAAKRSRPLVGIRVLTATRPNGPGKWSGTLYDVDRGRSFSGNLVELGPDAIRIEGCALGLCGGEELRRAH
jgi:uncharacterized protein (DUF2147 family)